MSLRIWLPLNGSLKNQGIDKVTVTNNGATINDNGKIGKCYSFDGNGDYIISSGSPFTNSTDNWSYACWFKPINRHTGCLFSDRTGVNSTGMSIFYYNTQIYFDDGTRWQFTPSTAITVGDWNHLVFIRKKGIGKYFYLNGVLINSTTTTGTQSTVGTNFSIGSSQTSNTSASGNPLNGYLNDVRLYDHALSPLEVKQISQGLILHYPLNRNGWGQENLITQGMIDADPWKSAIQGVYTVDGKTGWILANNILYSKSGAGANNIFAGLTYDTNTQYTISFKWRDDYRTDGKSSSLYIRFKYTDGTYSQVISSKDYNYWKEEIMTSTAGKTVSAITTTYGNGGNLLFTDLKLEKGNVKTPFSPITNSSLATLIGMNTNVVKDISGYQNNGELIGTFSYTTDTPKYNVSTYAQGGASTYLKGVVLPSEAKTVSLWIKSPKNVSSAIFNDKTTGLQIGLLNSLLYVNSLASTTPFTTTHWVNDKWNHVVVVNNNGSRMCYVNGEAETQSGANNYYIHKANEFWVWNRSYNNNYSFTGSLSDLRIYSTALSADEVKDLYKDNITD